VVLLQPIARDLLDVRAVYENLMLPRFMVVFDEKDRGQPADRHIAMVEAQKLLIEQGFEVVDGTQIARLNDPKVIGAALSGNPGDILRIATEQGVEVLIVGRVGTRLIDTGIAGTFSAGASIEAQCLNSQTGKVIAATSLELGTDAQRPAVTAFDPDGACDGAFRKAVTSLFVGSDQTNDKHAFLASILTAWLRTPTTVNLSVSKVAFNQRRYVVDALEQIRAVEKVVTRSYTQQVLSLEIVGSGPLEGLMNEIDGLRVGGMQLIVTDQKGNALKAELGKPAG
jgi:hypothetical protein